MKPSQLVVGARYIGRSYNPMVYLGHPYGEMYEFKIEDSVSTLALGSWDVEHSVSSLPDRDISCYEEIGG